jgi:hypothetical protein
MGWFSDFLDDPVGSAVSGVKNTVDAVGDVGQWAGDTVGNSVQSTNDNLGNYWNANVDLTKNSMTLGTDAAMGVVSNPLDPTSWGDPVQKHLDDFNQTGNDLFGTGGWIKAGANTFSTGDPFMGAGSVGYQLDSALSGSQYNNGQTSGIANLDGMYTMGNNAYNTANSPTSPTPTTSTTPSISGTNMNYNDYNGPSIAGDDYSPNFGQQLDLPSTEFGVAQSPYVSGSAPGYFDQAAGFLNSGLGRVGRAGLTVANPMAGGAVNTISDLMNGNYAGAAAGGAGLYQTYMNNKLTKQNQQQLQQYQQQMNDQIGRLNTQAQSLQDMYSPNSAYAQQMRESLNRQDAASGRRSQYGPREVQLQAALADKQASLAPTTTALTAATNGLTSQAYQNNQAQQMLNNRGKVADVKNALNTIMQPPTSPQTNQTNSNIGNSMKQGWDYISSLWS